MPDKLTRIRRAIVEPRAAFGYLVVAVAALASAGEVIASPPACTLSDAAMYQTADAVMAAEITSSRRWASGPTTLHLVAKYRVQEVFKGEPRPGEVVIVTDTCIDRPVPEEMLGYPVVQDYCLGGLNLSLTGVDAQDGEALAMPAGAWVLFLRLDRRPGAPEQTWLEVDPVSFYGYGPCDLTRDGLAPAERPGFDRVLERRSP